VSAFCEKDDRRHPVLIGTEAGFVVCREAGSGTKLNHGSRTGPRKARALLLGHKIFTPQEAVEEPPRGGAVGGWITHDRGSGVVFSPVRNGAVRMQAQIDYGRLRVNPGAGAVTETFALGWFGDARCGLEAYADAIAKVYAVIVPE